MEENHSFDNYFGTYPGALGSNGGVLSNTSSGEILVQPYHLDSSAVKHDLCHSAKCARAEYNKGTLNGFLQVAKSNLPFGYFDFHNVPYYWDYASKYVLMDNYYGSVMGSSLPNHLYLIAGQSGGLVDNLRNATFGFQSVVDELDASHISWKYYAGGHTYLNNWNPLPAFASFRANHSRMANLRDPGRLQQDISKGKLASVVWVMPGTDETSEHPPYDIALGEHQVVSLVNDIMQSKYWNSTAIFITFDEYGGWFDHVPPLQVDAYGYGFRVPTMIISPYAKPGFVDHTQADHTSILKFIETLYGLDPLSTRDGAANDLMEAFDFNQAPSSPLVLPGKYMPDFYPLKVQDSSMVPLVMAPTRSQVLMSAVVTNVGGALNLTGSGFLNSTRYAVSINRSPAVAGTQIVGSFNTTRIGDIPGPAFITVPELPTVAGSERGVSYYVQISTQREFEAGLSSAHTQFVLRASGVLSQNVIRLGENVTLTATGLAPSTVYQVATQWRHGPKSTAQRTLLGNITTDIYGSGSKDMIMPSDLPSGNYTIQLFSNNLPVLEPPLTLRLIPEYGFGTDTFVTGGGPFQNWHFKSPTVQVTYINTVDASISGVLYATVHNELGQMITVVTAPISIPSQGNRTVYLNFARLQPGVYHVYIFVIGPYRTAISNSTYLAVIIPQQS